ncbi:hypothetical protein, partial [Serratia bockelmannii]|uniref:hypothetical protein n=1 Tax=Serratia bockelmannii TaxID=2703793 RepID=UPI003CE97134
ILGSIILSTDQTINDVLICDDEIPIRPCHWSVKKHVKIKKLAKCVILTGDVNASLTGALYVGSFCFAVFCGWIYIT